MRKMLKLVLCCCSLATLTHAQEKTQDGFTQLPSGLEYRIYKHGNGTRKPQNGDHIEMNISLHVGDSTIFSSRKMNNNQPVPLPIGACRYKGDPMEGFMLMVAGDSAVFKIPVDSVKKIGMAQPWMKEGSMVEYRVALLSVKTDAEEKKDMAEKAEKQKGTDEQELHSYFKKHHLKPEKTASGLYYVITAAGTGDQIKPGQTVSVNYTGKFIDGKTFDSNTDTAFKHVQPLEFEVGQGRVIKGWDEGLQLLKKGAKASFFIPSGLAYGPMERPGIPANSILVFDVEILNVGNPMPQAQKDDKLIQEYLAQNHITASKTASGLYYRVIKEGTGEKAKPGQKVSMRYLGTLPDGQVFDGNMDENFNPKPGRDPFTFTLGVGQVIKGWDEGVALLNKGERATLYLPSGLAYGSRSAGKIPPNSVLIFDVEVANIEQ